MFGLRRRRRKRLRATPLPEAWWRIIDRRVPLIRRMSQADRTELGGIVQVLLDEKRFEGCGGLQITDEVRLTIAAHGALLLLHRPTDYYPSLKTILVYPHAYLAPDLRRQPDGSVIDGPEPRLGESWFRGAIVLSWDDVLRGAIRRDDGHNVALHEFVHQLDGESGAMEGTPILPSRARYRDWARVLGSEYRELTERVHRGHASLLDAYGAADPAEFFAVATEAFFERATDMKRRYPQLYAELARFYGQDPAGQR